MEAAGAIAGFVTVPLALFQTCVQAFELLQATQNIGVDGDLFNTKLQWEQYQLLEWGRKVGLDPELRKSPTEEDINWTLAGSILGQLESLLTSAEKLKTEYHLNVVEEEIKKFEVDSKPQKQLSGIERWLDALRPDITTLKGQIIQKNNRVLKRLRWAAIGRDQAYEIISDIAHLVTRLYQLLGSIDRDKRAKVDEILLRDILSRSTTASEVDQIQQLLEPTPRFQPSPANTSVQAAAKLKQIRLALGTDTREGEIKTALPRDRMPTTKKLKHRKLKNYAPDRPLTYEGMEFARYDQNPVLVEWKFVTKPLWKDLEPQVQCLSVLLSGPAVEGNPSLHCIGYLPWEDRELFALVYETPQDTNQDDWSLRTLSDLITNQPYVSLGRRYEIARRTTEAVLQLHTAGWLHKSLRTSNIVFLGTKTASLTDFLQRTPYIIGFEYARPDTPKAAAFTQLPDTDVGHDLYRHPQARGVERERYRKQFDVYALGCILLEIGMWQTLSDVVTDCLDGGFKKGLEDALKYNTSIDIPAFMDGQQQGKLRDKLGHLTGDAYAKAYVRAVTMKWSGDPGSDASLKVHHAILRHLQRCDSASKDSDAGEVEEEIPSP